VLKALHAQGARRAERPLALANAGLFVDQLLPVTPAAADVAAGGIGHRGVLLGEITGARYVALRRRGRTVRNDRL